MLTRLWSPAFKYKGQDRPVIEFRAGLNIVEGADKAENSIGKSTLLQIIDFIYGGKDFLKSDAVTLPQAVGHHIIFFTLRLSRVDHHFSRDISRPSIVTEFSDPNWQNAVQDVALDDYMTFLLESYGLAGCGASWRSLVGRFCRDDESDLALLNRPLAAEARESDVAGATALLQFFGAYEQIETIQKRYNEVNTEVRTLEAMAKGHYSNYVKLRTKTERKQAEKDLASIRSEAALLRRQTDLDLFETERRAREERQLLRTQLRPLTSKLEELQGKLNVVEATLAGRTRLTTKDLEEFYAFFPDAERELLETVEYYHHELTGILSEQLNEQRSLYQAQIAQLDNDIRVQKARIVALGQSVQLDDKTFDESLKLGSKIEQLEEQIETFDRNERLKAERKILKKSIDETIPATLRDLTDSINTQMREVNTELYPNKRRTCPVFTFKAATNGVSYTFDHRGDTGSGAKSKNLVLFDLAVLRSTPLPFVIHDSAIIKTIAYTPVAELLQVYAKTASLQSGSHEPKQLFFSFDAAQAYGTKAENLTDENQVIHLGEDDEALYGFTWNIETDDETMEGDEAQ